MLINRRAVERPRGLVGTGCGGQNQAEDEEPTGPLSQPAGPVVNQLVTISWPSSQSADHNQLALYSQSADNNQLAL
jgi:hypothetical protein